MSYNIVKRDVSGNAYLQSVTSSGMLIEGKPIYGARKQYATNKQMPLAGQASLKYTMDTDGILTGSCHKAGQGYSAWLLMNGKAIATFDNYGGESCSFDFPNVRVKAGDVIELTTNVPTTETTNFFWLNNIGVTPIVGMEPGSELIPNDVVKKTTGNAESGVFYIGDNLALVWGQFSLGSKTIAGGDNLKVTVDTGTTFTGFKIGMCSITGQAAFLAGDPYFTTGGNGKFEMYIHNTLSSSATSNIGVKYILIATMA